MMKKLLLKLFLISLLSVNIVAGGVNISTENSSKTSNVPLQTGTETPKIYIVPQNGTASVASFYTITVWIANVTNLYGFTIQMRWGTSILKYQSHTMTVGVPGGVLASPAYQVKNVVDEKASIAGAAPGSTCLIAFLSPNGFNGSGTVFNMTFQVLMNGECDIYFTSTDLSTRIGGSGVPIDHVAEDGYFYKPGLSKVPVADFTVFPDPAVITKNTTFDASESYDPDGGNIALYIWNFRDGTSITSTTDPIINHTFTSIPTSRYYLVELTVLDDQGDGSQSKPKNEQVDVVEPNPVAEFTVWPSDQIAVVNKIVEFNASESYDPDPGGNIVKYRWKFGDGDKVNVTSPTITHAYTNIGTYVVELVVEDDTDGLASFPKTRVIEVVEWRDIEVTDLTVSPSTVKQGEDVEINVTITNKGQAEENFNITAYYNTTATNWIPIDELSVSAFPKQYTPLLEFINSKSVNGMVNYVLYDWSSGPASLVNETRVRVGTNVGYWTINPGKSNTDANSPDLITGTPLTTGGWIWEQPILGPKKLNGEFSAGNWSFQIRLFANQSNVNATVWVRILKSDNPDPNAVGANVTVVKDWAYLFPAELVPTSATVFNGDISAPSFTLTDEYLYFEFQLQVTENSAGSPAEVVFQIGGPYNAKAQIEGTTFSYQNRYTLMWNTEFASVGSQTIRVETSEIPHETNTTNNIMYGSVEIEARPSGVGPLEITIDVGSIHFGGEIAEFYILVASSGRRVDASVTAYTLFNRTMTELNSTLIESIDTGIYLINYQMPVDAPAGTYTLVVDASRLIPELNYTQQGTALKSFLLSQTFVYWDSKLANMEGSLTDLGAMLLEIEGSTASILTSVGEIKANLVAINATLSGLISDSKGEILAQIDTALGPISAKLDSINVTVTEIAGDTLTINSTLGETKSSLGAVQSTITIGLTTASILSAVAAIVAILIFLRIRKLSK